LSDFNRPWGILAVRRDTMDYSQTLDFSSFYLLGSSGGVWGDDYSNYVDYVVHNKDLVLALFECSVRVGVSENGTAQQAGHWMVKGVETL